MLDIQNKTRTSDIAKNIYGEIHKLWKNLIRKKYKVERNIISCHNILKIVKLEMNKKYV